MKAVALTSALAVIGSVQAAGWQDAPVEESSTTTTTEPSKPTYSHPTWSATVDPSSSETWSDATWSTTTTTEPVKETTTTVQSYCEFVGGPR